MNNRSFALATLVAVGAVTLNFAAFNLHAAVRPATIVAKIGDTPAGGGGSAIATLNAPFTNGAGKVGFTGNLTPSNNFVWFDADIVWTNSMGAPDVLTGAEGTMGVSNTGDFIYSPSINTNDGVWTGTDGALAQQGDPVPGIAGQFITFCSRPIMLPSSTSYFVSGMNPTQGSATTIVRFMGKSVGGVLSVAYKGGDSIGGFTVANVGVEFGYDRSDNDAHYIQQFTMTGVPAAMDSFLYVDGAAVAREGTPTGQGANWATFAGMSVNNSGNYAFGSDDSGAAATDVSVVYNGVPAVREGATIDGFTIASGSSIAWVSINNLNKVAYIWNRTGFDALFVGDGPNLASTSKLLLQIGDQLDIDNDSIPDTNVIDFEASAAIGPGLSFSDHNYVHVELTLHDIAGGVDYEAIVRVPIPVPCLADIDPPGGNDFVTVDDLLLVINSWGPCPPPCPPYCAADIDRNCFVNVDDLLAVINSWGPCPCEPGACCLPNGSCEELCSAACASAGGAWHGVGSSCGSTICPISEAYGITFMESVMNGPLSRFKYSVVNTSETINSSSQSPTLTTVDANMTFTVRHDNGQVEVLTGSGNVSIQRQTPTQQMLDVTYSMSNGNVNYSGEYHAQHDLAAGTLNEQVSASLSDVHGPQSYSVNKSGTLQTSLAGSNTTISATVNLNGTITNTSVIDDIVILDPDTNSRTLSMSSNTAGPFGPSTSVSASIIESHDALDQMTAQITAYELDRNGQHFSLQSQGLIATTRVSDEQYNIAFQLVLTDGGRGTISVNANGMQSAIEPGGLTQQNKGWSWKEFAKSTVVGTAAGAAGGAVVGTISTDTAAPIGLGAGATIGAVGGAVTGAAGYSLGKAWDWAFGNLLPGPNNFQHDCHFGGIVTSHQHVDVTIAGP